MISTSLSVFTRDLRHLVVSWPHEIYNDKYLSFFYVNQNDSFLNNKYTPFQSAMIRMFFSIHLNPEIDTEANHSALTAHYTSVVYSIFSLSPFLTLSQHIHISPKQSLYSCIASMSAHVWRRGFVLRSVPWQVFQVIWNDVHILDVISAVILLFYSQGMD